MTVRDPFLRCGRLVERHDMDFRCADAARSQRVERRLVTCIADDGERTPS